ncbi:hypothetical protein JHC27_01750 [archaeon]|nr:hypothetical protein [archaeon]
MFRIQEETVYEPISEFLKWIESEKLKNVLVELYERFKERDRKVNFNSIVKTIRELVQER